MKIIEIEQNSTDWLELRKGKITGSKLKDIVVKRGTGRKIGFYQLIADRLSIEEEKEDPMERGHRLEDAALEAFVEATGLKTSKSGMWVSDDNENIACSPDAAIVGKKGKITGAVEIKCLGSARHIEALVTQSIPDEYEFQKLQYFIVNPELERLYFCFYDPRVTVRPFFWIEVERSAIEADIEEYRDYQTKVLAEVDAIVEDLSF